MTRKPDPEIISIIAVLLRGLSYVQFDEIKISHSLRVTAEGCS